MGDAFTRESEDYRDATLARERAAAQAAEEAERHQRVIRLMNYIQTGGRIPPGFKRRELALLKDGDARAWRDLIEIISLPELKESVRDFATTIFPKIRARWTDLALSGNPAIQG